MLKLKEIAINLIHQHYENDNKCKNTNHKKIGSKPAEQGGILMGKDGVITDFIYDEFAKTTGGTYEINVPKN